MGRAGQERKQEKKIGRKERRAERRLNGPNGVISREAEQGKGKRSKWKDIWSKGKSTEEGEENKAKTGYGKG